MQKKVSYLLIPVLLIIGYLILSFKLPKYSGQYVFMVLLFLADLYLWTSVNKQIFSYRKWLKSLVVFVYWLPLIMVIGLMGASIFVPIIDWNDQFRTFLLGLILIFYAAKILPVVFLILADIVRVIDKIFALSKKEEREKIEEEGITRSKFLQYLGFISGGLVLGTMFTGMFKWVYDFKVFEHKIKLTNLPADFEGMKIVQISDIHLGSWNLIKPLEEAVAMINEMEADLILFTGDLVNFSTNEAYRFEETLAKLKAKKGVFATLGNHDYGDYVTWPTEADKERNLQDLFDFFKRIGWKLLKNENEIIASPSGKLALIGVENWGASPRFPKYGDIEKAMIGTEDAAVRLLMTHDPSHWDEIIVPNNYPIDLSMSGHTHGFQFGIETPGVKWSPAKWLYKNWAGLYQDEQSGRYLYVNRGLGVIGYPGRIGILPEITKFELVS
ncbi:MAG: metallophosphoesterase [Bacteroidales bacterium]|jgi:predicted MPP superfamily phosphohydrolase|nr:metallophosphoesterase [Bacteroidales bacterium]